MSNHEARRQNGPGLPAKGTNTRGRISAYRLSWRARASRLLRAAAQLTSTSQDRMASTLGVGQTAVKNWLDERERAAMTLGDFMALAGAYPAFGREVVKRVLGTMRQDKLLDRNMLRALAVLDRERGDVSNAVLEALAGDNTIDANEARLIDRELADVETQVARMRAALAEVCA